MIVGGVGGGATKTGLLFEEKVDFTTLISKVKGYALQKIPERAGLGLYFEGVLVARCFKKHEFY